MATLEDLITDLKKSNPECKINVFTPSGLNVPSHFHITEIGKTSKKFIDCGGTERETSDTTFQIWVADDVDHSLTVGKLLDIIEAGKNLVDLREQIIFEYDNSHTIGLYGVGLIQRLEHFLNIFLVQKRANCLAPDKCGVKPEQMPKTCCGNTGCC